MDTNGNLISPDPEMLNTMQDLLHPVESISDIPEAKHRILRAIHKAGNRLQRKKLAKKLKVDWSEYQIYRILKLEEELNKK